MTFRELQALILLYRYATDPALHARIDVLIPELAEIAGPPAQSTARPLLEWHEDRGDVLWWRFPVEEPPYVGSPLDTDWPGYHTHWTPLPLVPREPT
jgi:hypothetical protein